MAAKEEEEWQEDEESRRARRHGEILFAILTEESNCGQKGKRGGRRMEKSTWAWTGARPPRHDGGTASVTRPTVDHRNISVKFGGWGYSCSRIDNKVRLFARFVE